MTYFLGHLKTKCLDFFTKYLFFFTKFLFFLQNILFFTKYFIPEKHYPQGGAYKKKEVKERGYAWGVKFTCPQGSRKLPSGKGN